MVIRWATRVYAAILWLYPRGFRAEFAPEMRSVFADAIAEASDGGTRSVLAVCLRELWDLPTILVREYWLCLRNREEATMSAAFEKPATATTLWDEPSAWKDTLIGMLPFLLIPLRLFADLAIVFLGEGLELSESTQKGIGSLSASILIAVWVLVLTIGWVKGFPRWSFPYWGLTLVVSRLLVNATSPGLVLFGYAFRPDEFWGWRAWIPEMVAVGAALLLTQSIQPLRQLVMCVWRDWTRLSFGFYGTLPVTLLGAFDEVHGEEFIVAGLSFVLALGALGYMRTAKTLHRALSLVGSLALTWLAATAYLAVYWNGRLERWMTRPSDWLETISWMSLLGLILLALLLAPALLGFFRRSINFMRTA